MQLIERYFPGINPEQLAKFAQLQYLYTEWNAKINVISRKDIENLEERHILHSLSIAKVISFKPGSKVMDVGTGGGFPGIPLAILFPETEFYLVDSIGKKILVVNAIAEALALSNVKGIHGRAETIKEPFDFIISRAVTTLPEFWRWVSRSFAKKSLHSTPNGILYLKGGDITEELKPFGKKVKVWELKDWYTEEFFETKKLVYLKA